MFIEIPYHMMKGNQKEIDRFLNSSTYLNASETAKMIYRTKLGVPDPHSQN